MTRRLQGIGSSILVSLPKEWVVSRGLEKGNTVEITASGEDLLVAATRERRRARNLDIRYPRREDITADITGAYLLGYDIIRISSASTIPAADREKIRESTRNMVGMEIVEEDPSNITMQFLLDAATLSPQRILVRMNSISLGMLGEVLQGMKSGEFSGPETLRNRDAEVNRQYFLLVRLIRSALVDKKLADASGLEGVDILDYRIAANLLENAGDAIVDIGGMLHASGLSAQQLRGACDAARSLEGVASKALDALVNHDRRQAIEAISLHGKYQDRLIELRAGRTGDEPMSYIDLIYGLERIGRLWSDVADLVGPIQDFN